jgi:acetyl-CoA carboxylase, biotin carboxylase subunit
LIVHAPTREEAIARMHRALLELTIEGVDTSRDFHLRMLEHDDFRRGAIEIQWLERHLDELTGRRPARDAIVKAAIAAVLLAERDRAMPARVTNGQAPAAAASSGWLRAARQESVR